VELSSETINDFLSFDFFSEEEVEVNVDGESVGIEVPVQVSILGKRSRDPSPVPVDHVSKSARLENMSEVEIDAALENFLVTCLGEEEVEKELNSDYYEQMPSLSIVNFNCGDANSYDSPAASVPSPSLCPQIEEVHHIEIKNPTPRRVVVETSCDHEKSTLAIAPPMSPCSVSHCPSPVSHSELHKKISRQQKLVTRCEFESSSKWNTFKQIESLFMPVSVCFQ
jgi:hypothetical protein